MTNDEKRMKKNELILLRNHTDVEVQW